jgi:hypothetical protein
MSQGERNVARSEGPLKNREAAVAAREAAVAAREEAVAAAELALSALQCAMASQRPFGRGFVGRDRLSLRLFAPPLFAPSPRPLQRHRPLPNGQSATGISFRWSGYLAHW